MALFWVVIVAGVVALVWFVVRRGVSGGTGESFGSNRPLDILKERYARGEIDREQYERMKQDLSE